MIINFMILTILIKISNLRFTLIQILSVTLNILHLEQNIRIVLQEFINF